MNDATHATLGERIRAAEATLHLPSAAPLVIIALAFGLRAIMAARISVIFEDGPFFIEIARNFDAGDWASALSHPYHPLYSALVAAVHSLGGSWESAALGVSVVGGTVAVAALYVFLRDAFDENTAACGAFLFAISPYAVRFTADVQSEGVYLAFFLSGLALLWRGFREARASMFFAAGVCVGLAYLTRPEGAGLVAIGVAMLFWAAVRQELALAKALRSAFALVAGGMLIATPYLATLASNQGDVVLSGKKSLARTLGLVGDSQGALGGGAQFGIAFVVVALILAVWVYRSRRIGGGITARKNGISLAVCLVLLVVWQALWPVELKEFMSVVISTLRPEVAVLLAIGLAIASSRGARPRDSFIAAMVTCYVVLLVGLLFNYGYLSRRHVLPLVPLALGYAGMGGVWLGCWVAQARNRSSAPAGAVIGLAVLLLAIAAPKALHDHREDVLAQRLAAEWLRDQQFEAGRVASNKRRTGFYAERSWRPLTDGASLVPLAKLARRDVRYIIADDRVLGDRGGIHATTDMALRELYRVTTGGRTAMVFELSSTRANAANISVGPPGDKTR